MANPPRRETAKIYRFPVRMRIAAADGARERHSEPARIYSVCDYGSGWYHDAAIQDDPHGRKH